MTGIWSTPNTFYEFADSPNRQALVQEIATRQNAAGEFAQWLGMFPDPDPVLLKRGDGAEVLEDLTSDDQVIMAMQNRKLGTLNKADYQFSPGAADSKTPTSGAMTLTADLAKDLESVDIFNLMNELLDAPYYGYTAAEYYWEPDGSRMKLKDIKVKPREWFGFSGEGELRFMSTNSMDGEAVPFGKFGLARHFPTYKNPYGLRLLSRCLWPVAFKKGGIRFWVNFVEKFGSPWVVGTSAQGAQDSEKKEMLSDLASMVQTAVAVLSAGSEVEIHESGGKAGDLHKAFYDNWNAAISKVLMGQTLTAELGKVGSQAASQTHYEVLEDYRKADQKIVSTFFDDLAWTYGQINAPGELSPTWGWIDPVDQKDEAEQAERLSKTGVKFTKQFYINRFGLSEDEFEVAEAAPEKPEEKQGQADKNPGTGKDKEEFASAGILSADQQAVEDMIAGAVPDGETAVEAITAEMLAAVESAESYEELEILLTESLGNRAAADDLTEQISRLNFAAEMWGQYNG